jgi:translation initiation factor 2B subunit (eIF-2B alpha/beta/delta family)
MNKSKSLKLKSILNNKTLGSSELVQLLNDYLLSKRNNKIEFTSSIRLAKAKLGHFEAINLYLKEINSILKEENKGELKDFLMSHSSTENEKIETIFNKIYPKLKKMERVITLSRSRTVLEILKLWHQRNKNIKIVICESRPKFEGRSMAKELADNGISVELITDAVMSLIVPKVDVAIIGADVVLNNGNIVNKVGSKILALLCREYKKPFYVVTSHSKFTKRKIFKPKKENPREIWDRKVKKLSMSNIYFEEIEKKFITKIFTD